MAVNCFQFFNVAVLVVVKSATADDNT